jgi:lysyl-tRNA synthetase, class II
MTQEMNDQQIARREKIERLKEMGIDPFGQAFERTSNTQKIKEGFSEHNKDELNDLNHEVKIAGRVMTKRLMGKAGFMHIQDQHGQIQIYVRKDTVGDMWFEYFDMLDLGDIVGVEGVVFRTNHGELSIKAVQLTHLTKALRPLPDKFHGLHDIEERYRRRYVDLIMNEESRKIAMLRPKIISAIREYFDSIGCVEVETPVLTPVLGGAAARPFTTHHNTLDMDFYLRIATELPLKRLIVGGFEGVYEIGRLFRNEGMSPKHNPEFTTVEAYIAYSDMEGMMNVIEDMIEHVAQTTLQKTNVTYLDKEIELAGPYRRLHMVDAIKDSVDINFFDITEEEALKLAKEHKIEVLKHQQTYGHVVNLFFEKYAEKTIEQPTFVYGHPVEVSPLAKINKEDPRFTERFELIIDGREYANAFSELNDPMIRSNGLVSS